MTELTIRPDEIRDAIERHVQGFEPETAREEVGRVVETGDGIARVEGLHSAMTNELLEFEGGLLGLALNLDVREIACDLLSSTGRKYLRGPRGTGFLYVAASIAERLVPAMPDHHGATWTGPRSFRLHDGARRLEHWEYSHAAWLGLGTAVDELLAIGLDHVAATVRRQAESLRSGLRANDLPVFDLGTERCGIVTTNVPGVAAADARRRLAAMGINATVTTRDSTLWDFERRGLDDMLRLSVHMTTTDAEIERALAAFRAIGRG